jgi:hypothetical protein
VLASVRNPVTPEADFQKELEQFNKEYYDFCAGPLREFPRAVNLREASDQDGGNGGGGEPGGKPMSPSLGAWNKTFWDFRYYPASDDRNTRFPPPLRFELCLHFQDIGYASAWLSVHPAGRRLGRLFQFVQIVALSTPSFTGTVIDKYLTDAFGAPTGWIG